MHFETRSNTQKVKKNADLKGGWAEKGVFVWKFNVKKKKTKEEVFISTWKECFHFNLKNAAILLTENVHMFLLSD